MIFDVCLPLVFSCFETKESHSSFVSSLACTVSYEEYDSHERQYAPSRRVYVPLLCIRR
jgi:hypothetical protein